MHNFCNRMLNLVGITWAVNSTAQLHPFETTQEKCSADVSFLKGCRFGKYPAWGFKGASKVHTRFLPAYLSSYTIELLIGAGSTYSQINARDHVRKLPAKTCLINQVWQLIHDCSVQVHHFARVLGNLQAITIGRWENVLRWNMPRTKSTLWRCWRVPQEVCNKYRKLINNYLSDLCKDTSINERLSLSILAGP